MNARQTDDGRQFHLERFTVLLNGSGNNTTGTETLDISYTKEPARLVVPPEYAAGTFDITPTLNASGNMTGWTWDIQGVTGHESKQIEVDVFLMEKG